MSSNKRHKSTRAGPARPVPRSPISPIATELLDIRQRLALAMACAYVVSAALKAQEADSDSDAAFVLQRHVGDELDRQIERLDVLAARRPERKQ
jgi:hypothetical protein